jgi:4-hydroxy-3-methylbut-2-enyl diphosphate reductase IspH
MLTDEQIKEIANKAERVVVTGDATHKDIGIKIGNYSQATTISLFMNLEQQERQIKRLQTDLVMMNQREAWQIKKATEAK